MPTNVDVQLIKGSLAARLTSTFLTPGTIVIMEEMFQLCFGLLITMSVCEKLKK